MIQLMKWKFDLEPDNKNSIIEIYQYFARLKTLFRQGWLQRGIKEEQCESTADHSFGMTILAMLLCPPELDKLKVLEISLLHEAGESIVGDLTPADNVSEEEKSRMELEAVKKIFSKIPDGNRLISIWEEFEFETSAEGKFVRQLDKLEMGLQAEIYTKAGINDAEALLRSALEKVTDPELRKLLKKE
jgi:5'-deoxynucleotidase YfbR-like HD superfamily hydrolase